MTANYHTHTWRCNHAFGNEREYIENAITAGLHTLGFSDHSPYIFPGDYYSTFRMRMDQFADYIQTVLSLRDEFAGRINIPLGLELEYYPELLPQLLPVLTDAPVEYLLLGQHFVGNEIGAHYCGRPTGEKKILEQYCDQSIEAMQSGLFTYFAHPDLIFFVGDDRFYRQQMHRICAEAKSCGIPLEINLLGLQEGRNYPDRRFWELAAEESCTVILGRDAHRPEAILDSVTEARAREIVSQLGLNLVDTVELKPIF